MKPNVSISIKSIKELEYSIVSSKLDNKVLLTNSGFSVSTLFDIPSEVFELQLVFDILDSNKKNQIVHIKVANVFKVENLASFLVNSNKLNLPANVLATMLGLSISHTRALLARNTAGTPFGEFYIPIVNPNELAKRLFNKSYD